MTLSTTGYGTKGRSAVTTLREAGAPPSSIVVVDILPHVVAEANRAGLAGVTGDATRRAVLAGAEIATSARLVIAVRPGRLGGADRADRSSAVPRSGVIAAVRESENEPLLQQSGADHVVVSSEAAGRLLGLATIEPAAGLQRRGW